MWVTDADLCVVPAADPAASGVAAGSGDHAERVGDDVVDDDAQLLSCHRHGKFAYFNGISAISNAWRSVGSPKLVLDTAAKLFTNEIALRFFKCIPGRVLKARWLSIESVERIVGNAAPYIGQVFSTIWGPELPEGAPGARRKGAAAASKGIGRGRGRAGKGKGKGKPRKQAKKKQGRTYSGTKTRST